MPTTITHCIRSLWLCREACPNSFHYCKSIFCGRNKLQFTEYLNSTSENLEYYCRQWQVFHVFREVPKREQGPTTSELFHRQGCIEPGQYPDDFLPCAGRLPRPTAGWPQHMGKRKVFLKTRFSFSSEGTIPSQRHTTRLSTSSSRTVTIRSGSPRTSPCQWRRWWPKFPNKWKSMA